MAALTLVMLIASAVSLVVLTPTKGRRRVLDSLRRK
jgi:hypothetical protein